MRYDTDPSLTRRVVIQVTYLGTVPKASGDPVVARGNESVERATYLHFSEDDCSVDDLIHGDISRAVAFAF